ncbi:apolipoprotein N-acyltransferase [Gymnodinialimonas hymeniacidonis]|uniref:apolipoprotein N-acyltransferase n=1 Tax=Gymnodinialimonas hymeniacidonis TaxID=3126508 RepID=UPI0034C62953
MRQRLRASLEGLGRWQGRGVAAFSGALAALALPPFDLWPLLFPALALVCALVATAPDAKAAAWRAWFAGAGWFGVATHWIVQPFFVDATTHGWMAPFAIVLMAGGLALFWAAAGGAAALLCPPHGSRAIVFAGLVTLVEAARGRVLSGLPWAQPGHGLIGTEALALSSLGGPLSLTLLTVLIAALSGALVLTRYPLLSVVPLIVGVSVAMVPWTGPLPAPLAPTIRVVQINAPQHLKWEPDMIPVFFDRGLSLTAEGSQPDLVIWPETSLPTILRSSEEARARIALAADGAEVLIGGQRYAGVEPRNVLVHLDADGAVVQVYDKHHLVPFGEYMPLRGLADDLGLAGLAQQLSGGYRPGEGPAVMDLGPFGRAFPMICYEAIFPHYIERVDRPDWLVQVTNDAWFGSFAMPYQHLALAQLRAAEQGLPLIRAANTGISAVIDAHGQIIEALPMDVDGVIDAQLPAALPPTLYARFGHLPVILLAVFVTGAGIAWPRFRKAH